LLAGETFVLNEISASGHRVMQSPLLFQGGNLLAVFDPSRQKRVLLIGEGEIHRNVSLGLSQLQIVELFRVGFGVDDCVVIPALSYHLDFDLTVREVSGELVVFVNDPLPLVAEVLKLGVSALEAGGTIEPGVATTLRTNIANGRSQAVVSRLAGLLEAARDEDDSFPARMAAPFKTSGSDLAVGNLKVFLQAADLYPVLTDSKQPPAVDAERRDHRLALRRWNRVRQAQIAAVRTLGWRVVAVPSMPDLYRGLNYLNGLQFKSGYVMPAAGGFYWTIDDRAREVFRNVLGAEAEIRLIECAELQRKHGAIHCMVAAYPVLTETN
jgi:hypothetical protein